MKEYFTIRDEIDRFLMRQDVISDDSVISAYDLKNILYQFFKDVDEYKSITKGNEVKMINKNLHREKIANSLVNISSPKMLGSICYSIDKVSNVVNMIFNFEIGSITISSSFGNIETSVSKIDNISPEFAESFIHHNEEFIKSKTSIIEKYTKVFDMNISAFGLNYVVQRAYNDLFCVALVASHISEPDITFNPSNEIVKPQKLNLIEEELISKYIKNHSDDILKKTELSRKNLDPRFAMILNNYEQQVYVDSKVKVR